MASVTGRNKARSVTPKCGRLRHAATGHGLNNTSTFPFVSMSIKNIKTESDNANDMSAIDPIWMSSRTARQIFALGEVEKVNLALGRSEAMCSPGPTART